MEENYQYIVFRNVQVTAGVPVIITCAAGLNGALASTPSHKAILNGMQIAKVPDIYVSGEVDRAFTN